MIPTDLQAGLKERLENAFSDTLFNSPSGDRVHVNIFEQNLPQKSDKDQDLFPFVIVKLLEGEQKGEQDEQNENITTVGFVIGTFDDDNQNQGYRDVTQIINKIVEVLKKEPVINRRFTLKYPLKWRILEEETDPYYYGAVETSWSMPAYDRQDLEGLI
ncbi:hypothetical protein NST81_02915 [Bacillus sp. FSL W8-0223]|uniref:hypothetical protein n=1 Tax=Bacillus sp. FSL W8-0223 TaxID=2954595 RepID=UPI0030FCE523